MYPSQHRMPYITTRSIIIWFILIMIILCLLYSYNSLIVGNNKNDCPTLVDLATNQNHIQILPNTSSTITINKNATKQAKNDNDDDEDDNDDDDDNHRKNIVAKLEKSPVIESTPQVIIQAHDTTELKHIVFGIAASSNLWDIRKEYIKTWWRPQETRGVVWLDQKVRTSKNEDLPDIRISADTTRFKYTNHQGQRSALRISRIVSETLKLGMKDVRWFVMGDDDTVFILDNVVRILNKYDHRQFYYVGSISESHIQNIHFSYAMAYGGGGFAISYPLAKELEKMQDRCIQRYPALYGSDDRIQACMAELGVPLTKEAGFHQYDVYGELLGLLAAHPVTPLVSLHHLDVVEPIFPQLTRVQSIQRLMESVKLDSSSIMQQSICYDKNRYWSISISWGYVVQISRGIMSPRELEMPQRTFLNWYKRADYTAYAFNTRPVFRNPCQKPFVFYISKTRFDATKNRIVGVYSRSESTPPACRWKIESPGKIDNVIVVKKPDPLRWQKSPRRDCCRVLPQQKGTNIYVWVGNCREGEVAEL